MLGEARTSTAGLKPWPPKCSKSDKLVSCTVRAQYSLLLSPLPFSPSVCPSVCLVLSVLSSVLLCWTFGWSVLACLLFVVLLGCLFFSLLVSSYLIVPWASRRRERLRSVKSIPRPTRPARVAAVPPSTSRRRSARPAATQPPRCAAVSC